MTEENGIERDSSGRFGAGNKASVGRGPNRVSTKVKDAIVKFLEDNIGEIQESFDELGPKGKLQFIAEILPYATPKLSAVKTENETKLSGGINISWSEPELHNPENQGSNGVVQSSEGRIQDHS